MKLPIAHCRPPIRVDVAPRAATLRTPHSTLRVWLAFSLIEILVVVGLLSVIILGLLAMFTQTQRAFRTGMTQTDVLEGGRFVADMIARELRQVTPSYQPRPATNFYAWLPNYTALLQPLAGSTSARTNMTEDLIFLTRRNQDWIGIGYFVRDGEPGALSFPTLGMGTLYRVESTALPLSGRSPADLCRNIHDAVYENKTNLPVNISKIMGGVLHFKVRAFDTNGFWIVQDQDVSASRQQKNTDIKMSTSVAPGEVGQYAFFSNAVPATVELEVGILEDRAWQHYKALPWMSAAKQEDEPKYRYVTNLAGRVHLFRQRIPIQNVDPAAYQ